MSRDLGFGISEGSAGKLIDLLLSVLYSDFNNEDANVTLFLLSMLNKFKSYSVWMSARNSNPFVI